MREKIRTRQFVMTLHADEEMNEDGLTIFDVESVIFSGKIVERQRDQNSGEFKYLVKGKSLTDEPVITVVKTGPTGKLVIVTVFCIEETYDV